MFCPGSLTREADPITETGLNNVIQWMQGAGPAAPWLFLFLFLAASCLMLWRLEAMTTRGVEGTVLGTLVMPYCSGMGNLIFAFVLGAKRGPGQDVIINSLVNNVTNLTLLIGLPTMIWGMNILETKQGKKKRDNGRDRQLNRLSLLLTLTAVAFFTGAVWALGADRRLDFGDGLVLVGLFLFWQCFHVFDVLKNNVRQGKSFSWMLVVDLALLGFGAYCLYLSTDWLVAWLTNIKTGFVSAKHLGWLSGWLMVLPNAFLAFYYARRGSPEVVYSSQVGDGHICIPLCIGIFALFAPAPLPPIATAGFTVLMIVAALHFLLMAFFGRLPRLFGAVLVAAYAYFLYSGLMS